MAAREFTQALFDIRFEQIITTQMLPAVYSMAIAAASIGAFYWAGIGFEKGWITGVVRLFVLAPIAFIVTVVAIRSVLEFFLAVFRIAAQMDTMAEEIARISGDMKDVASLPRRIRFFWEFGNKGKSREKPRDSQQQKPDRS